MRTTGKYNDSNELEFIKNIYKIGRRLIREYFGDGLSSTTEESSIGGMRSIQLFFYPKFKGSSDPSHFMMKFDDELLRLKIG